MPRGVHAKVSRVLVLMPCLDDAATAAELIVEAGGYLRAAGFEPSFLVIDDGSIEPLARSLDEILPKLDFTVEVMELKRNLGHQRAIACGLCHASQTIDSTDAVVVMDSDGEDRPEDVPVLVRATYSGGGIPVVAFAERIRRTEGVVFRAGYLGYLLFHWILVGHAPRVGNYSAIPASMLSGLVTDPDLWSHYAATIWKSRRRRVTVPLGRGVRRRGRSRLGLGSLVLHGLAAISCYRETLSLRVLVGCAVPVVLIFPVLAIFIADSPWEEALILVALSFGMISSLFLLAFSQCFLVLQSRNQSTMLPIHDYLPFVNGSPHRIRGDVSLPPDAAKYSQ